MRLVNAKYGLSMDFAENKVNCLVIENATAMADIIGEFYMQSQGKEGNFVLMQNNKELKISKSADFVIEPFSLSVNSKKYIAQLYDDMSSCCNDVQYELKNAAVRCLVELLDKITVSSGYDITFDLDITPESLFKAANVKFNEDYSSLKEKLIQYISIISALNTLSLIIFVNLKNYMNEEDLNEIYQAAFYNKVAILLIESSEKGLDQQEKVYIIDRDLCIIEK